MSTGTKLTADHVLGGWWGNAIEIFSKPPYDFNKPIKITGWKTPMVKDGQTLLGEFTNSFVKFEIRNVEPCGNPEDMFFADAIAIEQEMKS